MPFIEASDKVWLVYSRNYCCWLKVSGICDYKNNLLSILREKNEISIFEDEERYLPTVYMTQTERFVEVRSIYDEPVSLNIIAEEMNRKSLNGLVSAADFLNLITIHYRGVIEITDLGSKFVGLNKEQRSSYVKELLLELPHVDNYVKRVLNGEDSEYVFEEITRKLVLEMIGQKVL